jgi:ubiquinone/menaquinone biosynthesis C-methylase UbiE
MASDMSLFHYGRIYKMLIDPMLQRCRDVIVTHVPAGARVLDAGCGTGQLCFALRQQKGCQVVGMDLSLRMLAFAQKRNPFEDVRFLHQDATNMGDLEDGSFDYVVACLLVHELTQAQQLKFLTEAWRVGGNTLLLDSNAPLPWNAGGVGKRLIEFAFGYQHYPQFNSYLDSG